MKKAKILIVDDRHENLVTLESLLDSPDVETVRAQSGEEALAHTLEHDFALVLLDVQMPGMDGYEVAELMRGNKNTRHMPIIFLTAEMGNINQIFRGYQSGAVDYLFKPLDIQIFRSKVDIFLELFRQKAQLEKKSRELDAKVVELEELQQALEETNEQLRLVSSTDGLTGLLNRRRFDEILQEEWQRGLRSKTPISLLIVDVDHFKEYNDLYGHLGGDNCLKLVAQTLADTLQRCVDRLARYGGEEFAVILPNTEMAGAVQVANRMRRAMEQREVQHFASETCSVVTVSIGVRTVVPCMESTPEHLIESADRALYRAKEKGRNQVCCG